MTWQMIVLIAIIAVVAISIGAGTLMWAIWRRATREMTKIVTDMDKSDPFRLRKRY